MIMKNGNKTHDFSIDFLGVGFQKCATTTLDAILRQHAEITLPKIKEIHLDMWYQQCKEPMKVVEKKFFGRNYDNGKKGIIDPEFENNPQLVAKCFGAVPKLIFIMRNPVDRLYSFYKMALCLGFPRVYRSTRNGGQISEPSKCFARYVRQILREREKSIDLLCGEYVNIIEEYEKYFPEAEMKFVFFEDYIKNPKAVVGEILTFLELPDFDFDDTKIENEGSKISRNRYCFKLNYFFHLFREELRCNIRYSVRPFCIAMYFHNIFSKLTLKENREKMSNNTREKLQDYYRDSKSKLEMKLNRDLSEIWFI